MTAIQEFVLNALRNTPQDQLQRNIDKHTAGHNSQAGSIFNSMYKVDRKLLEEFITHELREITDEVRAAGNGYSTCRYFEVPLDGTSGVVKLDQLDWDGVLLRLVDPKGDLGTDGGSIQAVYDGRPPASARVTYSTIIVGDEAPHGWTIWSVFPGAAVKLSMITDRSLLGRKVTVDEAKGLGFETALLTRLK